MSRSRCVLPWPAPCAPRPELLCLLGLLSLGLVATGCDTRGRGGRDDDDDSTGDDDDSVADDDDDSVAQQGEVAITRPQDGDSIEGGEGIRLEADLTGTTETPAGIEWRSSLDGALLFDLSGSVDLAVGQHDLTVSVVFGDYSVEDSVSLTVLQPPHPAEGSWDGTFSATVDTFVFGIYDCPGNLAFTVDGDGILSGAGSCVESASGSTVPFDMVGVVSEAGAMAGEFTIPDSGSIPTLGEFSGNVAAGQFDETGDSFRMYGTWEASR